MVIAAVEIRGSGSITASDVYTKWSSDYSDDKGGFVSYAVTTAREGISALTSPSNKDVFAGTPSRCWIKCA